MKKINLMINGLPGNVAATIVKHVLKDDRFSVVPYSLTGPEINDLKLNIDDFALNLVKPETRDNQIKDIKKEHENIFTIDFTHPAENG